MAKLLKKLKKQKEEEESSESEDSVVMDSDEELQLAFQQGLLKPGLNYPVDPLLSKKRETVNNVTGMKEKLADLKVPLAWIERLDLTTDIEPIVQELVKEQAPPAEKKKIVTPGDQVHDDLQREVMFYRQAQSAALEGLIKLKALGIPTKRPTDYFAQMAKSDDHMLKVKRHVLEMQMGQERSQKVKKLRELKKYGKQVQVEVGLKRAKEKRELLDKVKQYREGKLKSLDFLDEDNGPKADMVSATKQKVKERNAAKGVMAAKMKRNKKDSKFGFGGKKKGSKRNDLRKMDTQQRGPAHKKVAKGKAPRPGKSKRVAAKNKGGRKR